MAKAVENDLPVDGDPEQAELSQDRDQLRRAETNAKTTARRRTSGGELLARNYATGNPDCKIRSLLQHGARNKFGRFSYSLLLIDYIYYMQNFPLDSRLYSYSLTKF